MSQQELAASLGVNQATISKLERRTDMYISTMRRFIDAIGGELEIRARFSEGVIAIEQFAELDTGEGKAAARKGVTRPKTSPEGRTRKHRPKP